MAHLCHSHRTAIRCGGTVTECVVCDALRSHLCHSSHTRHVCHGSVTLFYVWLTALTTVSVFIILASRSKKTSVVATGETYRDYTLTNNYTLSPLVDPRQWRPVLCEYAGPCVTSPTSFVHASRCHSTVASFIFLADQTTGIFSFHSLTLIFVLDRLVHCE